MAFENMKKQTTWTWKFGRVVHKRFMKLHCKLTIKWWLMKFCFFKHLHSFLYQTQPSRWHYSKRNCWSENISWSKGHFLLVKDGFTFEKKIGMFCFCSQRDLFILRKQDKDRPLPHRGPCPSSRQTWGKPALYHGAADPPGMWRVRNLMNGNGLL